MHLGRLLQERGYINEHQLIEALRAQAASGGRLGSILIKRGCLSDAQLYAALRTQDDLRRAGVVFDLAIVAGSPSHGVDLALAVTVPHAGSQGGLPHHGIVAQQHILVPANWLPGVVGAENISGAAGFVLNADDGRMLDYGVGIALRSNEDALILGHARPAACQAGEPREDGFEEITLRVTVSADSLRDGGAGRFSGRLGLRFGTSA